MPATPPPNLPPNVTEDGTFPHHPSDILIDLVAALLTPMFISATGGDLRYARLAALETVSSYRVTTQADLLQVVQIIAFSLAAIRTLCVSMAEDISIPTLLRLNLSADRLSRAESRTRNARQQEQARSAAAPAAAPKPPRPAASVPAEAAAQPRLETSAVPVPAPEQPAPAPVVTQDDRSPYSPAASGLTLPDEALGLNEAFFSQLAGMLPEEPDSLRERALGSVAWNILNGFAATPDTLAPPPG